MTFQQWFARYLNQDESQVKHLLDDATAINFLIAWSIFESKCFGGFAKIDLFSAFAKRLTENLTFDFDALKQPALHFHNRYQDKQRYCSLMHKQKSDKLTEILGKDFGVLSNYEITLILLIVIYRFRNNIFHGNKGVDSWLFYREQIELCINAMQLLIPIDPEPA
ncbi:MAG: hypothetical protein IPQ16_06665 [Geobacteraceae bacterium]|nr:hypothetical protein [Geobacteraceae bacterium]